MGLWLRLEHSTGQTFAELADQLSEIATRLDVPCIVRVNEGVDMFVLPGELGTTALERWLRMRHPQQEEKGP